MTLRIVVDMNLSPLWVSWLHAQGLEARHWSEVGKPTATDREVLSWANAHGFIVLTADLDFGAILAASGRQGPSVIQVRARDLTPQKLGDAVMDCLEQHRESIQAGALVAIDGETSRVRLLPLRR